MRYDLKTLPVDRVDQAWVRAEKYRDLNEPDEADSICRDILAVAPAHQPALRTLGLALTDRFPGSWRQLLPEALSVFERLGSEYERVYFSGLAWERCAKAQLEDGSGPGAYGAFQRALGLFQRALALGPDEPDPVLRWNRCVRALTTHPLLLAEEAGPPAATLDHGDGAPA
jgi:tetratricopeptide (TPR) repeat protein